MGDLGQREHSSNYRTSEHNDLMGDRGQSSAVVTTGRVNTIDLTTDLGQREHSSNYSDG